jgi:hypothetical protein
VSHGVDRGEDDYDSLTSCRSIRYLRIIFLRRHSRSVLNAYLLSLSCRTGERSIFKKVKMTHKRRCSTVKLGAECVLPPSMLSRNAPTLVGMTDNSSEVQ